LTGPEIGLSLATAGGRTGGLDPGAVAREAIWAEERGFGSVWVGDHVVHHGPILDAVVAATVASTVTSRVQVGIGVLLLAMRGLVVPAKQLSSLAAVSGGRLTVGIGVGGEFPDEWAACGVPTAGRGARTDEYLPSFTALLAGEPVDHHGAELKFRAVQLDPLSPGPVPILGSGRAERALRRAATLTDGWLGFLQTPAGVTRAVAAMRAWRAASPRAPQPFTVGLLFGYRIDDEPAGAARRAAERLAASHGGAPPELLERFVVAGPPAAIVEGLRAFAAAGCSLLVVNPADDDVAGRGHQLERFAAEVLPRLADH
jgi:alkanesulfonate monooxygenase SsuD/methylene tetrahydromethanopterin reductase-like flavin-dependent oxidoreductase (luciferase family)